MAYAIAASCCKCKCVKQVEYVQYLTFTVLGGIHGILATFSVGIYNLDVVYYFDY